MEKEFSRLCTLSFYFSLGFVMLNGSTIMLVSSIVTMVLGAYFIILGCLCKNEAPSIDTTKSVKENVQNMKG